MEHWAYHYNEGIASKEAKDFEASAAHHLRVLEMEPDLEMPEAWHNAGAALLRLGRTEQAAPYLQRAIELYDMLVGAIREVDELELTDEDYEDESFFGEGEEGDDDPEGGMHYYEDDEFDIDNEDLYGDEPVAYYLFWKACCLSLLKQKERMLAVLSECIAEDDWYAIEAGAEEDMQFYRDDPDFKKLVDPIVERISSPEHKHLFDIFERIEKKVLIGFEDPIDFVDEILEDVEAEGWTDKTPRTWIRKTIRDLYRRQQDRSHAWTRPTDVERLAVVFNQLCKEGILALHKTGFSQLEAIDEVTMVMNDMVLSPEVIKGFCFYSGENVDELIYREKGTLYITFNSILLDDPQFGVAIGNVIADRLREAGFTVVWDGTMKTRVEIRNFSWKKVFVSDEDQQQWDHWRVFDFF